MKTIRPELSDNARVVTRFLDEVRLAKRISHANVCRIQAHFIAELFGVIA